MSGTGMCMGPRCIGLFGEVLSRKIFGLVRRGDGTVRGTHGRAVFTTGAV